MKIKAKTNKLLQILSVAIVAVFALCSMGTLASSLFKMVVETSKDGNIAYAANNAHALFNDTDIAPVPYGTGAKDFEIGIQYDYTYNFDVRFTYRMYWVDADGSHVDKSTTNVILNYVDRNSWIVDEYRISGENAYIVSGYIYRSTAVTAGKGKLVLFSGLTFTSMQDEEYLGLSLKIDISEVKIAKEVESYTTSHPLYLADSSACTAWMHKKSASTNDAYVIIYNSHYAIKNPHDTLYYLEDNGIAFEDKSAFYKSGSGSNVTNALWLGGNRYYAGVGMYIVAGNASINLTIKLNASWQKIESAGMVYENAIFKYSAGWKGLGIEDNLTETCHYKETIPAHTAMYIPVADYIEITSITQNSSFRANYHNYRLFTNSTTVNNTLFTFGITNPYETTQTVASGWISNVDLSGYDDGDYINVYSENVVYGVGSNPGSVSVSNSSSFQLGLYDKFDMGERTYPVVVRLTNNTDKKYKATVNYTAKYYISNGLIGKKTELTDEYSGTKLGADGFAGTRFYEYVGNVASSALTVDTVVNYVLEPYSSAVVLTSFKIANSLSTAVDGYDVWIELIPTISAVAEVTSVADNQISIEHAYDGNNLYLYARNNTSSTLTLTNIQLNYKYENKTMDEENAIYGTEPSDWKGYYWNYFTKSGDNYIPNTSSTFRTSVEYYKYSQDSTIGNITPTGGITIDSGLTLLPNETKLASTYTIGRADNLIVTILGTTVSVASESLGIINNGTKNAYIYNPTSESYYVRLQGNVSDATLDYIYMEGGYSYYIGIVRPYQIIPVPMSNSCTLNATAINSSIDDWSAMAKNYINTYLGN